MTEFKRYIEYKFNIDNQITKISTGKFQELKKLMHQMKPLIIIQLALV